MKYKNKGISPIRPNLLNSGYTFDDPLNSVPTEFVLSPDFDEPLISNESIS